MIFEKNLREMQLAYDHNQIYIKIGLDRIKKLVQWDFIEKNGC